MNKIVIKGAREHNLKNINVEIPRDKFIVITGLSGSGKSTLAFDTIYAEGQRKYVESLSAYARQFLSLMNKPDVDSIDGLSPAISIEQKTTSKNPRSTVGTVTEIYDYLRLLYARIGTPYCPEHNIKIESQTSSKIAKKINDEFKGMITILSPIIRQKKGTYEQLFKDLNKEGYTRVRVDKALYRTDEQISLDRYKKHDIEIVIDRLNSADKKRLSEACENALKKSDGLLIVLDKKENEKLYSSKMACPKCGMVFEELQPRMFSFNSPFGACKTCHGLGIKMYFDPELIIPDSDFSIADGAIKLYRNAIDGWRINFLGGLAKHYGFSIFTPIKDLTSEQYDALMYGSDEKIRFDMTARNGDAHWSGKSYWEGLIPQSERLYKQTESDYRRRELERFMRITPCPVCNGKRLKEKVLSVKIADKSIIDVTDMSIKHAIVFFKALILSKKQQEIAWQILKEIKQRLNFLDKVGLNYLTLSRSSGTLSGGESQRIRLATQIGSNLMGVLYILDEPSIGLHQRDNKKLIDTLYKLRDLGNTLIVVEHDEETIRHADYVIDMGPGAGLHGGKIVAQGTPLEIEQNPVSLTGKYLSGKLEIQTPESWRYSDKFIHIYGCREHNLKDINIHIPIGVLSFITGVSGSGKSTLIYDILYRGMMRKLHNSKVNPGDHDSIQLDQNIDKVIVIDQSPIGKTPRSNPATYTKVFDEIRKLFAKTPEAKRRGYKPGRFSFNVKGGRCEACQGDGMIKIEMNFLPDIYVQCEECKGKRYNNETLELTYKGKNIADVLDMTVEEAHVLFQNIPYIKRKLETLSQVGLNYIKLGQSSTTLSGGEAQRIKLTRELSKRSTGKTLYLLDEPTTGLHYHDVKKLIDVLNSLVDKGNTVVIIEHNLEMIKSGDYIIDLGPEGGDLGGYIVAQGTPAEVTEEKRSYTGQILKPLFLGKKNMKEPINLPTNPGCYLFKNSKDNVIYIGKAKNLKKRIKNYFKNNDLDLKTQILLKYASNLDFVVTDSEEEALILENTLIKKYQPKYNIRLKDAKSHSYLLLTKEEYPRVIIDRWKRGKGIFFGPFISAQERDYILYFLRRTFLLRTCKRIPKKPCLRYHINLCDAPCIDLISKNDYNIKIEKIKMLFNGKTKQLLTNLKTEMKKYSDEQYYEKALKLRNEILAIEHLSQRQKMQREKKYNEDIINYIIKDEKVYLMLFNIYKGTLHNKNEFEFDYNDDFLEEFIIQYYSEYPIPKEVIVPDKLSESIEIFLSNKKGSQVRVLKPQKGEKKHLLDLVSKNIEITFFADVKKVDLLKNKLNLQESPNVIECFDISHLSGTSTAGSMVQFRNGKPDKNNYRRFKIRSVQGIDDYTAIGEVVSRRYKRLKEEDSEFPDLIIIDGGRGQLNFAIQELKKLNLKIPIISIAKQFEEIYIPGALQPLRIQKKDKALQFIQEIRNEAHRFAIKYNRLLRKKEIRADE